MAGLSLVLILALVVLWPGSDEPPKPPPDLSTSTARQDLAARALDDLQGAVRRSDPDELDSQAGDLAQSVVANAAALRVGGFTVRYLDEDSALSAHLPEGQWAASVALTWRFAGFDVRPVKSEVTVVFAAEDDRATVVDIGGGDRRTPLWLIAPLHVQHSDTALVMAVDKDSVERYAEQAETAVRQVRTVIPRWHQKLVMVVPGSGEQLDRVLNAEPGRYANIAAVTTTVDGTLDRTVPVHVYVNPDVFDGLKHGGAQVVTTHELVHVATGAATASAMPLWLVEGFADYVALRDVDLPLSVTAGQILGKVRRDGVPDHLPSDGEFDTRTQHLGTNYEAAWLACRLLAQTGSEQDLLRFHQRVSEGEPLARALSDIFGLTQKELVARWQRELRELAR